MKTPSQGASQPAQLPHLASYHELQDAVYHMMPLDCLFGIYAPIDKVSIGYFRDLMLKSLKELHGYIQTKPQAEVNELAFTYLRCIIFLADHAYMNYKSFVKIEMEDRSSLAGGIVEGLLDLINLVHQYWGDCNLAQTKVPDVLYERDEEKELLAQYEQLKKILASRELDQELSDIILAHLYTITYDAINNKKLTWQHLYYSKQLMKKLLLLHQKEKLTNELLLTQLMELNYNNASVISLYIQMIRKQMTRRSNSTKKLMFLKEAILQTRLWHLPEHKGLHPGDPGTKEIVMHSLEDLLHIQQLKYEEEGKAGNSLPVKKDPRIVAWFIRMWREVILLPGVPVKNAMEAFNTIHALGCGSDRLYNYSYELETEEDYDSLNDALREFQKFLDKEWRRIRQKKEVD